MDGSAISMCASSTSSLPVCSTYILTNSSCGRRGIGRVVRRWAKARAGGREGDDARATDDGRASSSFDAFRLDPWSTTTTPRVSVPTRVAATRALPRVAKERRAARDNPSGTGPRARRPAVRALISL
jgi:hypothetical protein